MHRLFSILLALLMSIALLAAAIYLPATEDWVMLPLMEHFAPPEDTGLPAAEYKPVVKMITGYLKGGNDAFQHIFTVNGTEYAAFNQKEQHHMADVQDLFRLCRKIAYGSLAVYAVLRLIQLAWCPKLNYRLIHAILLIELILTLIVVTQAVTNFDSLFFQFHKVAFTNDLWLLNPQTDLLIRLMPIEFFVSYAAIIGGIWLLGMVAMLVVSTIRINKTNEGE